MIILMKLNHEQISLIPEEKYRRVKYRKLNDLYLWYNFNIHKLLEYLMTSKFDDSRYRESCSRASTPSIITQRTFNFVTNSNNDSIILESTNNDILEWFWGSLWAWLHHHSQLDILSLKFYRLFLYRYISMNFYLTLIWILIYISSSKSKSELENIESKSL